MPAGLNELSRGEPGVHEVWHLRDLFPGPTPDTVWLKGIADLDAGPWFVISIDKFRKKAGAERLAIRRHGHVVYVLDPSWSKAGYWAKAANLVSWWEPLLAHARLTSGGVFRVRWRRGAVAKFEAI